MPPTVFFDYCTTAVTHVVRARRTSDIIRHPQSVFEHDETLHSIEQFCTACLQHNSWFREFPISSIHICTAVNWRWPDRAVFVIACCQCPCMCSCFRRIDTYLPYSSVFISWSDLNTSLIVLHYELDGRHLLYSTCVIWWSRSIWLVDLDLVDLARLSCLGLGLGRLCFDIWETKHTNIIH